MFSKVKERIQKKLELPEKEFEKVGCYSSRQMYICNAM